MALACRVRARLEPTSPVAAARVTFTVRGGATTSAYGNINGSSGTITATSAQMETLDDYASSNQIRITWSGSTTNMTDVQFV